jgi:hypothetical protein
VVLPSAYDLTHEEAAAEEVAVSGGPVGSPVDPAAYPPPQYGEAVLATIAWLRGQTMEPPIRPDTSGLAL